MPEGRRFCLITLTFNIINFNIINYSDTWCSARGSGGLNALYTDFSIHLTLVSGPHLLRVDLVGMSLVRPIQQHISFEREKGV